MMELMTMFSRWCFTVRGYCDGDVERLQSIVYPYYAVFRKEGSSLVGVVWRKDEVRVCIHEVYYILGRCDVKECDDFHRALGRCLRGDWYASASVGDVDRMKVVMRVCSAINDDEEWLGVSFMDYFSHENYSVKEYDIFSYYLSYCHNI